MKKRKKAPPLSELKPYWARLMKAQSQFREKVNEIEEEMRRKVRCDLFFFMCDDEYVGIGNDDRTMRLIRGVRLDTNKQGDKKYGCEAR